ncbi:MAG: glycosyltransferase [Roseburia sp.]|nr:glycosyltransferase [Roseburia sp.]
MSFGYDVSAALDIIRRDNEVYKDYLSNEACATAGRMIRALDGIVEEVRKSVVSLVKTEFPFRYPHVSVWWYSVLIAIEKDPDIFKEFVSYVRRNAESFSLSTQYYLFYQLKSLKFKFPVLDRADVTVELWKYFEEIVDRFAEAVHVPLDVIPENRRNHQKAIVITEQFISIAHRPTKTAADRCKVLMQEMKKDVTLINTAEVLSFVGGIPFYNAVQGSYMEEGKNIREQCWKGVKIPYVQCENDMPNIKTLDLLLEEIRESAPGYVVTLGGNSMLANLVNRMVPVLSIGLCPSALAMTTTKYQLLGRKINREDKFMLEKMGISENRVIESVFMSSLKPQTEQISREELHVPADDFLMIVIGARLDQEVTPEFLEMLDSIIEDGMHLGFLGHFSKFEPYLSQYPKLRDHASNFGFAEDILSRLEVCDLYINPNRTGGGTSCVEAMYKGVPVVTLNHGDVAVNAGV